jgi:hypothetical protein
MKHFSLAIIVGALFGTSGLHAQIATAHIGESKQMYTSIKGNLMAMADKMPGEGYSFRPTADIRSFGQIVAHVADVQARFCSTAGGMQKSVSAGSKTSQADLVVALKSSFEICDASWDSLNDSNVNEPASLGPLKGSKLMLLEFNTTHSNEEYGYMSVYLRLKGIVPPSSAARGGH